MREDYFHDLASRLLAAGIAQQHIRRTVDEVRDHFDDLVAAESGTGVSQQQAAAAAIRQLGPIEAFVDDMASRRELKSWAFRFPRAAVICYPVACAAMLPAYPILASVAHASSVARWGASFLVAGIFTGFLLLLMQLSIFLG